MHMCKLHMKGHCLEEEWLEQRAWAFEKLRDPAICPTKWLCLQLPSTMEASKALT